MTGGRLSSIAPVARWRGKKGRLASPSNFQLRHGGTGWGSNPQQDDPDRSPDPRLYRLRPTRAGSIINGRRGGYETEVSDIITD